MSDRAAVQLDVPVAAAAMRAAARAVDGDVTTLDPPHISLGYPWVRPVDLRRVRDVGAATPPIHVRIDDVDVWGHPERRVVHLTVDPADRIRQLAADLGWDEPDELNPHVSLVRVADTDEDAAMDAARRYLPGEVLLDELHVYEQSAGQWHRVARVRLGA